MKITVINKSDVLGVFSLVLYRDAISMESVEGLVENVRKRAAGQKVSELVIMDHGLVDGMHFGRDWVDLSTINLMHKPAFKELSKLMAPNAIIKLLHCSVGASSKLLQTLANLTQATVIATPNYTNPILRVNYAGYGIVGRFSGDLKGILPNPIKSFEEYVIVNPNNK